MKKVLGIILLILTLALSGCSETYTSVDAQYIDYQKTATKKLMFVDVDYVVTIKYDDEIYKCDWARNPRGLEQGETVKVILEYCELESSDTE